MKVHFLGTGDSFGSGGRFQACILLESGGSRALLDCGASSLIPMKRAGIDPASIEAVLVSHVHADHFAGIPFFVLDAQFISKRDGPLVIAGPPGIEARLRAAQEALFSGSSTTEQAFEMPFVEWRERQAEAIGPFRVTPFEVVHGSGLTPYGLRVEAGGATIAYSGDTEWTDALIELSRGTDLFICEANFFDRKVRFHLDYETVLSHRGELQCKRLLLTHFGPEMAERAGQLEIECAHDGMVLEVGG